MATTRDLIKELKRFGEDQLVVLSDGNGWSNIGEIKIVDGLLTIFFEEYTGIFTSDRE
jgi:hypothetical protein